MITAILFTFFAISALVSAVLVAACTLAGRTQEIQALESGEMTPAIAEVKLPYYHLRTSLSS